MPSARRFLVPSRIQASSAVWVLKQRTWLILIAEHNIHYGKEITGLSFGSPVQIKKGVNSMHTGMLWFDNSQSTLPVKIQKAVEYYHKKYGRNPDLCLVHPSMLEKEQTM